MLADAEEALAIREAFERADRDGAGILSMGELADVFREIDQSWTDAELEALFDAADANGVGFIRYREFAAWLMQEDEADAAEEAPCVALGGDGAEQRHGLPWGAEARLLCLCHAKPQWWDRRRQPKGAEADPALGREGEQQALLLARRLASEEPAGLDLLVCGPARRALGTAERLAGRGRLRRAVCHAQLAEPAAPSAPGAPDARALAAAFPALLGAEAGHEVAFVGFGCAGEGGAEASMPARARHVAEWLCEESKAWRDGAVVGICSHPAVFDCLFHVLAHGDASRWDPGRPTLRLGKAALSEIRLGAHGAKIVRLNDTAHLG